MPRRKKKDIENKEEQILETKDDKEQNKQGGINLEEIEKKIEEKEKEKKEEKEEKKEEKEQNKEEMKLSEKVKDKTKKTIDEEKNVSEEKEGLKILDIVFLLSTGGVIISSSLMIVYLVIICNYLPGNNCSNTDIAIIFALLLIIVLLVSAFKIKKFKPGWGITTFNIIYTIFLTTIIGNIFYSLVGNLNIAYDGIEKLGKKIVTTEAQLDIATQELVKERTECTKEIKKLQKEKLEYGEIVKNEVINTIIETLKKIKNKDISNIEITK